MDKDPVADMHHVSYFSVLVLNNMVYKQFKFDKICLQVRQLEIHKVVLTWAKKIKRFISAFLPHSRRGIVFTHGVRLGDRAAGKSLSGLYLRNYKV